MPTPTQENMRQSLAKLKEGLPLFQQDIFNIASQF
jgi:hypothetical protein